MVPNNHIRSSLYTQYSEQERESNKWRECNAQMKKVRILIIRKEIILIKLRYARKGNADIGRMQRNSEVMKMHRHPNPQDCIRLRPVYTGLRMVLWREGAWTKQWLVCLTSSLLFAIHIIRTFNWPQASQFPNPMRRPLHLCCTQLWPLSKSLSCTWMTSVFGRSKENHS